MNACGHKNLDLLPPQQPRLRCRHCHLTIKADELLNGCCPECLEAHSRRSKDFEQLQPQQDDITRYRCETCGLIIEVI
jgi:hypothetical protein